MVALKNCGNKKGERESFIVAGMGYLISYISNKDTNFKVIGNNLVLGLF